MEAKEPIQRKYNNSAWCSKDLRMEEGCHVTLSINGLSDNQHPGKFLRRKGWVRESTGTWFCPYHAKKLKINNTFSPLEIEILSGNYIG